MSQAVELMVGSRILTSSGVAVVSRLERHGVLLRYATGEDRSVPFSRVTARAVGPEGVVALESSLMPWWAQLTVEQQRLAIFRLQCVMEVRTGYREGLADLAQPGEPFWPFGPDFEVSLSKRYEAMSKTVTFERTADRVTMQRVYDGEVRSAGIAARTLWQWDQRWSAQGLRGLVDGRSTKGKQGFEALDPNFRRIAAEVFAEFDGTVSQPNLQEIERRIRVRLKAEGVTSTNLPERLSQEFLSFHYRALGRGTRANKSRKLRKVSSHASYPAHHPGQLATDLTRADNLVFDPVDGRPISVELGTVISTTTRVVHAARIFPRSADRIDAGLLIYDVLRQFSMVVEGTTIDDFRWCGIPESLDFSAHPVHVGQRRLTHTAPTLQGVHYLPGVTPAALRSDNGSIFVSTHFRAICQAMDITLMLSRGKKPTDNPHCERLHETYQRAYQQVPGFKGRSVFERGSFVGVVADEPLLTAEELQRHMHRFIALDYHRQPHDGLALPGAPGARITPLEYSDALCEATGRVLAPQYPDLIYQFLPIRWLTPGHAGVEYKNLSYDAEVLREFRIVRPGSFREQDCAMPFHYDPRDVNRLWFRHPDTGRVHEVPWRGAHLIHAPMTDVVRDRALHQIRERGGNRRLNKTVIMRQIIDEITELTTAPSTDEWRTKMSAARLRHQQALKDHAEVAEAHRILDTASGADPSSASASGHLRRLDAITQGEPDVDFTAEWPDLDEQVL